MIIKEISIEKYQKLKDQIKELKPEIEVNLLEKDTNLFKLGFSDYTPCDIDIKATKEQLDDLLDMILMFEIDAYDTSDDDEPTEIDESYINYQRYGWIYNFLYYNL
ncbi:MAG: hypothetical protein PHQ32_06540 [Firmicutes bacterium]|nr:hypothetical protein [Bacillota bacterium]